MQIPSKEQFSRIFGLIEEFDELPSSQLPTALGRLHYDGEPTEILTYLRLNYSLPSPPEFEFEPGERIADHYTIREKIGAGGMGVVYRAEQDRTRRDVALKLIHPRLQTRELLDRFEEEIITLGKLDHPGIVHLFDADSHGGSVFFTMRLVDGEPLHRHLRSHSLTRHQKLDLIISLCEAVQAAHDRGIIHRDLKPGNILIERASGSPVILDFGLATIAGGLLTPSDGNQTISGLSGTPEFMSPEQFLGTAGEFGAGQSIDVYALGAIAFELLAGHSPYEFPQDASWAAKRRVVLEDPPRQLEAEPELDEAVRKALRKDPADRYFTASGFAKALSSIQRRLASPEDLRPPVWQPEAGATVPSTDWILEEKIGEGGIGQVWLGKHPDLDEKRVFKFCEDEEKVRSLKREASLFRLLKEKVGQHPNIVRLHDVSLDDAPYFIAMDHISGGDLQTWADTQGGIDRIPIETRIDIIAQAATTLQAAHDAGILHRDIKPSNLLIESESSGSPKVYIADFGIGQLLGEDDLAHTHLGFTRTIEADLTTGAGSHRYMAPEILTGQPATVRSDIYSLGVVLYQSLIGDFEKPVTVDWYENIDDPLLQEDLKRCFAGDPDERFPSASLLATQLATLDARRHAADLREQALQRREKAAYHRGLVRSASVAATIIFALAWLSWFSYQKYRESWENESRLRLAQIRALRQSNQPERHQMIRDRLAEPRGKFPTGDIPEFRDEALAALSVARPYGTERYDVETITSMLRQNPVNRNGQFIWTVGDELHSATLLDGKLTAPEQLPISGPVSDAAVSDRGERIATVSSEGILLVSTDHGDLIQLWDGCAPEGVAIHATGLLAVAGRSGRVRVFSQASGSWDLSFIAGEAPPRLGLASDEAASPSTPFIASAEVISFSPDGRFLAIGGQSSLYVQIWNLQKQELACLCRHLSYLTTMAWDRVENHLLWTASGDGMIQAWKNFDSVAPGDELLPVRAREAPPDAIPYRSLDASPDGYYLVACAEDGSLAFLGTETLTLEESRSDLNIVTAGYLPNGDLWTVDSVGNLQLRAADDRLARSTKFAGGAITRLARSPDNTMIAASCGTDILILDARTVEQSVRIPAATPVAGLAFSPTEEKLFAATSRGLRIWTWEPGTDDRQIRLSNHAPYIGRGGELTTVGIEGIRWLVASAGSKALAMRSGSREQWQLPGEKPVTALTGGTATDWFAIAREGSPTTLHFPRAPSDSIVLPDRPDPVLGLACTPEGSILVERTTTGIIISRSPTDAPAGVPVASRLPPPDARTGTMHTAPLAISDDGALVAATTVDSTVLLIDTLTSSVVAKLGLPTLSTPTALIFTAADDLIAGSADGKIWSWQMPELRGELNRLGLDWKPPARYPSPIAPVQLGYAPPQ